MSDQSRTETATEIHHGGISRRHILGMGAVGVAGSLLSPPAVGSALGSDGGRRLLLKDGIVLTLDRSVGDFGQGDVLIEDGKIKTVARTVQPDGAQVIDCSGLIVMPGFVDTHRHMWQGLLRNIGPDDLLLDYLNKMLFGFAPKLTPDEVYLGDLITTLSAVNSGITCILDWSHINATPQHADAAIQGLRDAGIRAVYAYGPNFGVRPAWYDNLDNPYPGDIRRLRRQYFSSPDQLLTLALAAAGPEFASVQSAEIEWKAAREVGARVSVHVGVGQGGKQGLLGQLAQRVPLGNDTTYIHACTLSDAEWDRIRDTGGTVSFAIPIEMQMGHGMPPVQRALDRGIRPSLSVDVETNQPTDMFTQMRAGHWPRAQEPALHRMDLRELRGQLVQRGHESVRFQLDRVKPPRDRVSLVESIRQLGVDRLQSAPSGPIVLPQVLHHEADAGDGLAKAVVQILTQTMLLPGADLQNRPLRLSSLSDLLEQPGIGLRQLFGALANALLELLMGAFDPLLGAPQLAAQDTCQNGYRLEEDQPEQVGAQGERVQGRDEEVVEDEERHGGRHHARTQSSVERAEHYRQVEEFEERGTAHERADPLRQQAGDDAHHDGDTVVRGR